MIRIFALGDKDKMNIRWRQYEGFNVPYLSGTGHHSCERFYNKQSEPFTNSILKELIVPGDTVVDLGAHIGQQTYIMSNCVGHIGRVMAFEPDLEHAAILAYGLSKNMVNNVSLFPAAADDETGYKQFPFGLCGEGAPMPDDRGLQGKAYCIRLDDLGVKIHGIKCDTQGREAQIFRGAAESLKECRWALVEYHDRQEDYIPVIVGMGFKHKEHVEQEGASKIDLFVRE